MKTRRHYDELDVYRGLAALVIVVFHAYVFTAEADVSAWPWAGTPWHTLLSSLDAAVMHFFVLSGFLVTLPFARAAIEQGPPVAIGRFLRLRAWRLLPLYYALLLPLSALGPPRRAGRWHHLLAEMPLTHIFSESTIASTLGVAWSLGNEATYYLLLAVCGSVAYYACRAIATPARRAAILAVGCTLLIGASVAYNVAMVATGQIAHRTVAYGPASRGNGFAMGMLLAVVVAHAGGRPWISVRGAIALRATALALTAVAFVTHAAHPLMGPFFYTLCALGFVALLAATLLGERRQGRSYVVGSVLGALSYGVYLWHLPIISLLIASGLLSQTSPSALLIGTIGALVLSLACATVTYRLIERPVLRWARQVRTLDRPSAVARPGVMSS